MQAASEPAKFDRGGLEAAGFEGWFTFDELRASSLGQVPAAPGVYVVWRKPGDDPTFLRSNPGGRFKERDPTVDSTALLANWVVSAEVVYIGKASPLKRRLTEFERFGAGQPIGHWGGRLIWQLADSVDLRIAWKTTPDADPRDVESDLISSFRSTYGKPPFANEPHRLGT